MSTSSSSLCSHHGHFPCCVREIRNVTFLGDLHQAVHQRSIFRNKRPLKQPLNSNVIAVYTKAQSSNFYSFLYDALKVWEGRY